MFHSHAAPIPRSEALLRDHFARGERIVDLGKL